VATVFTAINGVYYWTQPAQAASPTAIAFIKAHSEPADEVLLWAWQPRLLLDTGRVFATRLLVNSPLIGQLEPVPQTHRPRLRRSGLSQLWPAFLGDLAHAPPRIIVDDPPGKSDWRSDWRMERYPQFAPFLAGYDSCQIIDDLCIYLRRN
jgi:hypothetical protein